MIAAKSTTSFTITLIKPETTKDTKPSNGSQCVKSLLTTLYSRKNTVSPKM